MALNTQHLKQQNELFFKEHFKCFKKEETDNQRIDSWLQGLSPQSIEAIRDELNEMQRLIQRDRVPIRTR